MKITGLLAGRIALASTLTVVAACAAAQEHDWDYGTEHGPAHWGHLKPEFAPCQMGHHQSPIDIATTQKADLPALELDYHPTPLRIIDNGHTVMVTYAPGSSLRVGDRQYALQQFHFHRPSEEKIHGKGYEMSVHLVHADATGHLAVVAILLEKGQEQPLIRELWRNLPKEKGKQEEHADILVDAAQLLPEKHAYYTFEGSLTTPPCTENVTWFVLKQPVSVSSSEIERFSKIYSSDARPVQPLYDRVVMESR